MEKFTACKESMRSPNAFIMKGDTKYATIVKNEEEKSSMITVHASGDQFRLQKGADNKGTFLYPVSDGGEIDIDNPVAHAQRKEEGSNKIVVRAQDENYLVICGKGRKDDSTVHKIENADAEDGELVGSFHKDIWKRALVISYCMETPKVLMPLTMCLSSAFQNGDS